MSGIFGWIAQRLSLPSLEARAPRRIRHHDQAKGSRSKTAIFPRACVQHSELAKPAEHSARSASGQPERRGSGRRLTQAPGGTSFPMLEATNATQARNRGRPGRAHAAIRVDHCDDTRTAFWENFPARYLLNTTDRTHRRRILTKQMGMMVRGKAHWAYRCTSGERSAAVIVLSKKWNVAKCTLRSGHPAAAQPSGPCIYPG